MLSTRKTNEAIEVLIAISAISGIRQIFSEHSVAVALLLWKEVSGTGADTANWDFDNNVKLDDSKMPIDR